MGCTSRKGTGNVCFFELDKQEPITELFDYIESAETVPLETTDECLIGTIDKILAWGNRYYILDGRFRRILCFDAEGHFLSKLDKVGRGPGEYLFISDFDIRDGKLYVLEMDRIIVYNLSYVYQNEIAVNYLGDLNALAVLEHDCFVVAGISEADDCLVHIVDGSGKVTTDLLKCRKPLRTALSMREGKEWAFQRSAGKLYLSLPLVGSLYEVDVKVDEGSGSDREPVFTFETGRNVEKVISGNVSDEKFDVFWMDLESRSLLAGRKIVTPYAYICSGLLNGQNLLLLYDTKNQTGKVFNPKGSILAFLLFGDHCFPLPGNFFIADVSLSNKEVLSVTAQYSKVPFERDLADKLLNVTSDQNNPVLVRYSLK